MSQDSDDDLPPLEDDSDELRIVEPMPATFPPPSHPTAEPMSPAALDSKHRYGLGSRDITKLPGMMRIREILKRARREQVISDGLMSVR